MWLPRGDKENVAGVDRHVLRSAGETGAAGNYEVDLFLAVRLLTIRSASGEPIYSDTEISRAKELEIGLTFVPQSRQVVDFHGGF